MKPEDLKRFIAGQPPVDRAAHAAGPGQRLQRLAFLEIPAPLRFAILAHLQSRGLNESIALHSRRLDQKPVDPDLGEFVGMYREAILSLDSPPSPQTRAFYLKKLNLIARLLRINRIRALTPERIDEFKHLYTSKGLECGRTPAQIRTSLNTVLRNAASLFSQDALAWHAKAGVVLTNPFAGKLERAEIRGYTPMPREILALIVRNSVLLRDGDPKAPPPSPNGKLTDIHKRREILIAMLTNMSVSIFDATGNGGRNSCTLVCSESKPRARRGVSVFQSWA
ncbi:MAG: hypothetical protein M1608_13095 [Candidatus Omnitrophica bacterium]|nr:hypothetical protein [Candidatus Omnitrophota bacterium]